MSSENPTEDMLLIYQTYCEDIRHSKNQQWAVTNYVLLLMAGIIGFYQLIKDKTPPIGEVTLALVALIIAALGTFFVIRYQFLCKKSALRIDKKIKVHLSRKAQMALDRANLQKERFFDVFLLTFIITQWIGAFFVNWFINFHFQIPSSLEFFRCNWGFIVQIGFYILLGIGFSALYYHLFIKRQLEGV